MCRKYSRTGYYSITKRRNFLIKSILKAVEYKEAIVEGGRSTRRYVAFRLSISQGSRRTVSQQWPNDLRS